MTERIGDFFRRRIAEVQPCVEDLLHVSLGEVQMQPMASKLVYVFEPLAHVSGNFIHYNTSPLAFLPSGKCLWFTFAHELAHIAHHVLVGASEFFCFKDDREGFADYIAAASMKKVNVDMDAEARIGFRRFRERLAKGSFPDTIDGAIAYVRAHSDVYRKSDGDYKMLNAAARIAQSSEPQRAL